MSFSRSFNHEISVLVVTCAVYTSSVFAAAPDNHTWRNVDLYAGIRFNADAFDKGLSKSSKFASLTFELANRAPFEWLVEDKNYYTGELAINHESDAEAFDADRTKRSHEYSIKYQRPFKKFSSGTFISITAEYEYGENIQQTEEFERLVFAGFSFNKYTPWLENVTNWGGTGAFACSEEEKDDELPRVTSGIGRDSLNREGCGYYASLHADTITSSRSIWSISIDHYDGDYGEQYYSRLRIEAALKLELKRNNSCEVSYRVIIRESELDFLGRDDELFQFRFGCRHLF